MGKVIVSGGCRASLDLQAGNLGIGATVKLMENSVATDFIVVQQGLPGSMYDSSCDGTWLLRKNIHSNRQWNSSNVNTYATSLINTWLNQDYFNALDSVAQSVVKQIKIPYLIEGGIEATVQTGRNGLLTKIFLLGAYEVGWTTTDYSSVPIDGTLLGYFVESEAGNSKRIAYLSSGTANRWWLRSPRTSDTYGTWNVTDVGACSFYSESNTGGVRPALIIPSTARFDRNTLLLKG